jgi:hypothetical protein
MVGYQAVAVEAVLVRAVAEAAMVGFLVSLYYYHTHQRGGVDRQLSPWHRQSL